jgi:hypothetical protein
VYVAEGSSPSTIRENTELNIQDSANKGRHRSSNTIKLKREKILEVTRRDWDVGELIEVWLGERRTYKEQSVPSPLQW